MDRERFVADLRELGDETRRLAQTIADPAISSRLLQMADELDALSRGGDLINPLPRSDPPGC
jgi:hypothetical protein